MSSASPGAGTPCVLCGTVLPESELLYGDRGLTCGSCVLDRDLGEQATQTLWLTVLGPPILALAAWLTFCIPVVGVVVTPVVGALAAAGGISAFLQSVRMNPRDEGVDAQMRTYLMVSGIGSAVVAALVLVAYSLAMCAFGLSIAAG